MIKIIRRPARNVNFDSPKIEKSESYREEKANEKKEKEIKNKFSEIKNSEKVIRHIQSKIEMQTENIPQREKALKQKKEELEKMASLWANISKINLDNLTREEFMKVINSQKGFIKHLLEHYMISMKNEKQDIQKIKQLKSKK